MRIVKEGEMGLEWKKQAICTHCKCEVEVEESDVRWAYRYVPGNSHPMNDYCLSEIRCTCPMCDHHIHVCRPEELPRLMQDRLRDRMTEK